MLNNIIGADYVGKATVQNDSWCFSLLAIRSLQYFNEHVGTIRRCGSIVAKN